MECGKYHMIVTESQKCDRGHRMVTSHTESQVTSHSMWQRSQLMNMRTVGDMVHSHNSNCIYSIANLTGTRSFLDRSRYFWCIALYGPWCLEFVLFFLLIFSEVIINPYYSPLQAFKHQDILMTKLQLIVDAVRNGILYHFSECSVIPTDLVLKLGKLDKVVDGLAIIWKKNCNNSVLVIIFWWVWPK